jgi:plastocyanin
MNPTRNTARSGIADDIRPRSARSTGRRVRVTLVAVALLCGASTAGVATAGVVRGMVWMTPLARSASAPLEARLRAQAGVSETVVYVDAVPDNVEAKLAHRRSWFFGRVRKPQVLRIVQVDQQFKPRILAVATGTPIEFRNMDRVYHSAFSVSSAKRFDLGKYAPGRADTVVFNRAGMVNLHCDIHPDMVGYLMVTPNHAFTRPDSTGRFKLPNLPRGTYTVRAVNPAMGEMRRVVTMPKRGDIKLELLFR